VAGAGSRDTLLSRAHFMLKASPNGTMFVNGVPAVGGGLRPPLNGTRLLSPQARPLQPGEEYLIESGKSATFSLPNGTVLLIGAE
jgi:hypothetical protein